MGKRRPKTAPCRFVKSEVALTYVIDDPVCNSQRSVVYGPGLVASSLAMPAM